jgi:hypothetical protein
MANHYRMTANLDSQPEQMDNINIWFHQDGVTSHMARTSMDLLCKIFPRHIISYYEDVQ